jgi:ferredoxin
MVPALAPSVVEPYPPNHTLEDSLVAVDADRCAYCGSCVSVCSVDALDLREPPVKLIC